MTSLVNRIALLGLALALLAVPPVLAALKCGFWTNFVTRS